MSYRDRRRDNDDDGIATKRARGDGRGDHEDLSHKIHRLVVQMGDPVTGGSLESNLEDLIGLLEEDFESNRSKLIDIITSCVIYMPHKLTVYSTLVGLLNAKHFNFGGEIVEKLGADLQGFLETQSFSYALYISIFLCDLGNCRVLSLNSIVEFLEGYIEAAFEENIPQVRSDWFVYAVLHSLPWIGGELSEKKGNELDNIMDGLEKYLESRHKQHIKLLHVWTGEAKHDQEEYLDSIWAQIKSLKEANWKERFILRHYVSFDAQLQDALQHNLPTFTPPAHQENLKYPNPWVVFRLFDYTDCPDDGPVLPGAHSIERFLLEEELTWIIDQNCLDKKQCAHELLHYPKRSMVPLPYCILEVVFSQMFRLPNSPYNSLFYGALLIELCKLQPESVPQVLAQAAELLYQRVQTMQPICLDRFVEWFSFHLSNFAYRWSWGDWKDGVKLGNFNQKKIFAREVVERCMRFSYYDKIKELLPADFEPIMPPNPEVICEVDDPTHIEYEKARFFTQLFQEKATHERILPELMKEGTEEFDGNAFAVFLSVMFKLASKSFSHNFSALMRYHKVLKEVCDSSEDMQATLLRTLYASWKNNHQYIIILVDKFLKAQIIDCGVLVEWCFSDEMKAEQHRLWIWEVLNSSLLKLSRHVYNLKKEIEKKKKLNDEVDDEMDSDLRAKIEDLENLVDFEKNLFLAVLHRFSLALTEHVVRSEKTEKPFRTEWFEWMIGRFREIFLKHSNDLWTMNTELREKLFSATEINPNVVEVYEQFVALRS